MKKISATICVYLWLIFLCLSISAQDFKTIQDGIEYAEMTREIDKTPVKMNLLAIGFDKGAARCRSRDGRGNRHGNRFFDGKTARRDCGDQRGIF